MTEDQDTQASEDQTPDTAGEPAAQDAHAVDPKLLEILVCPVSRVGLRYDADAQELISTAAGLAYPIRDGIPIMLPEEARELSDGERKG